MSVKVTAIIERKFSQSKTDSRVFRAQLSLGGAGKEYGPPVFYGAFEELADTLKLEAGVTHQELEDCYVRYQKGEPVQLALTLNDEAIKRLGFSLRRQRDSYEDFQDSIFRELEELQKAEETAEGKRAIKGILEVAISKGFDAVRMLESGVSLIEILDLALKAGLTTEEKQRLRDLLSPLVANDS